MIVHVGFLIITRTKFEIFWPRDHDLHQPRHRPHPEKNMSLKYTVTILNSKFVHMVYVKGNGQN